LGTTARDRAISLPEYTPREAAAVLLEHTGADGQVALLFGRERTGLENEELMRCHGRVFIPCNPDYASLNLASAVQVLSYEIRLRRLELELELLPAKAKVMDEGEPASLDQIERLFVHLGEFMDEIDFHKGRSPDMINQRLRRLFLRAQMDEREIKIIRGMLSDAQRLLAQKK
jgi:tRNA (cytidine32/uridine32-2'-O)-methyltransferase